MSTDNAVEVRCVVEGGLGRVTLNRPRAINALTTGMIRDIAAALAVWEHDDAVRAVLVEGAGERGLCAGADIRALHASARARDGLAEEFLREEYHLNARLRRYTKPVVAFMDGIVMGGGVGLSAHTAVRVVTERSRVGMPETDIGFLPDVGGTYLLSRTPGLLGAHAALTAARLGAADALLCGLADHYVTGDRLPGLAEAIAGGADPASAAAEAAVASGEPAGGVLEEARPWIDDCYDASTVAEVLERLRTRPEAAARRAAEEIEAKSPTSLAVTLRALNEARALADLEDCLNREYRITRALLETPDFLEGVRAAVIDKDRAPKWSPSALADVTAEEVEAFFAPRGPELGLAAPRPQ
ncbi:enoyl-CoA hydratase/isomerase family protein [Actinorugispora endophytica]|uniref:3-hydroxyisobutyryl-CoA hydrolase n=1 Tax=Actinorugispora endophytica TaxID=1605990 RepID=A0A4R6UXL2_9ACTN|nr:enoyl-CoA hydratase/isomerase family protein [Actinorugispora endophytica]TDQ50315.1 enoyl-CoA hydratase [Actinorugispora endophytica]